MPKKFELTFHDADSYIKWIEEAKETMYAELNKKASNGFFLLDRVINDLKAKKDGAKYEQEKNKK